MPTTGLIAALSFALAGDQAVAADPHVEAVTRTVIAAKGKVEKTEDGRSLKLVDLAVPGARGKLGENVTVQFTVRGGRAVSAGKRVLLNSEADFKSDKNFTVVLEINAMAGPFAKATYDTFKGKTIRASGTVKEFNKQIEIVVEDAKNLEIVGK